MTLLWWGGAVLVVLVLLLAAARRPRAGVPAPSVTPPTPPARRVGHRLRGTTDTGPRFLRGDGDALDDPAAETPWERLFATESVDLHARVGTREEAIALAGRLLVERGAVDAAYVDAMLEREQTVSTYMGNLLAIPHGTARAKDDIHFSAVSFLRLEEPVEWNGRPVRFVVGIGARNRQHLQVLGRMARVFSDPDRVAALERASTPSEVLDVVLPAAG